jgi:hypothetical protein
MFLKSGETKGHLVYNHNTRSDPKPRELAIN